MKKHYLIYQITNLINGKIYIGQHETFNIVDDYMGSGKLLGYAQAKYGIENFKKEILFNFDTLIEMDYKEIELVNEEFIARDDTYNIALGGCGGGAQQFKNTVIIYDKVDKINKRIKNDSINKERHIPIMKNKLVVKLKDSKKWISVSVDEYYKNKNLYDTPSSGKTTVIDIKTGKSIRINCEDVDKAIHKNKCGGIIAKVNGKNRHVTKQYFKENSLDGLYKNKVTAIVKETGKCCHIDKDEFNKNRHLYKHNTEGVVTGRHKVTNIKKQFNINDITDEIKNTYNFSTSGQVTVFDNSDGKIKNILCEERKPHIHKYIHSKKFKWYTQNNILIEDFFGSKKEFNEIYHKLPKRTFNDLVKNKVFKTNKKTQEFYNNSYIILDDSWKTKGKNNEKN